MIREMSEWRFIVALVEEAPEILSFHSNQCP
jgi:hypothetical protein